MRFESAALVFAGGAVGTTLRALLAVALPATPGAFPVATFTANIVGSLVLGWLVVVTTSGVGDPDVARRLRLGFGTGLCGGFTTFSTFMIESDTLLAGAPTMAFAYLAASALLGVAAAVLGGRLGLVWPGRRGSAGRA